MTSARGTQEFPRLRDGAAGSPAPAHPYELIFERAQERIAALDASWQQALGRVQGRAAAPPRAASVPVPVPRVAAPPVPVPAPRAPVGGPDTVEAVIARAEAPRWRRSLAS